MTMPIPKPDLKFTKTTDKKQCPKCSSFDFVDTGYRADNISVSLDDPDQANSLPKHPIYRCNKCAQLFRLSKPE